MEDGKTTHTRLTTATTTSSHDNEEYPAPTEEEKQTLSHVPGSIPWVAYVLCIVELAERASYYGASTVFNNFMEYGLPEGAMAPVPWPRVIPRAMLELCECITWW